MQTFDRLVTVFGGSGFVGRHVVRALAKRGFRIRVAVRRPDLAGHLQPLGSVGQINFVQANLRYPDSVRQAVEGAEFVVNCVGILYETGRQRFDAVQARGAGTVAKAAAEAGAKLIHISAIGADAESAANYARTKAAGEAAVLAAAPDAVILRPSIVFGPEDDFFNRFAGMAQMMPILPLVGGGETKFQPVFVGDVAEAVMAAVDGKAKAGTVYELGGPAPKSFRELLEFICATTGRKRLLVPMPFWAATFNARFMQLLPKPMLTVDQVELLKSDNLVGEAAKAEGRTLEGLGIHPQSVEAIVPSYLWRFRRQGQFSEQLR
ncbi:complex I NDUFA9 subunit family protein [Phreatobacter aquaticus]|uniref:Complex I NDUFA9 subunit family protein n=1 Tax=Phreatobacter aquaticus TaxID=2570229 RepID=A0A4D7QKJ1_9HYPH|nr:complex I NDUFA9 subunit family protein [Phreatobacter aquaticus]QCK85846.1 complex I NDUFA9 subunit family protein [Phreatobacter aquaticus]